MKSVAPNFPGSSLARNALEICPSPIVIANDSGEILFANSNVEEWFGYPASELTGLALQGLLPALCSRDQSAHGALLLSQSTQKRFSGEPQRVICKDGTEVFVKVTLVPVQEQSQSLILANFNKAEPTATDAQRPAAQRPEAQRLEAQRLESERLHAIETMVSGLAHESRNALQRAVACLDLMELDLREGDGQLELSEKIRRSLSDLLENYDEVRRFAEPISLCRRTHSLLTIFTEAYRDIRDLSSESTAQLLVAQSESVDDRAAVDSDKIMEVFRQVIANAIDQQEPVTIRVSCLQSDIESRPAVRVSIHNDGQPFGGESLRRAFEPFYTTKQHGTGLGLSVCQRIIHAHGGIIQVSDPEQGGAQVDIDLPTSLGTDVS